MEQHVVKIKAIDKVTHNVLQIVTEKPQQYNFKPGQATEVAIHKNGWINEKRPFTFTCLPENDYLEFIIKTYPSHKGVTNELLQLKPNDELILHEVFGTISYQGEGVFIAGGAGITPFISIFRFLEATNGLNNNKLIFANKTKADIILEPEFRRMLGNNFVNILSNEKAEGYSYGYITTTLLRLIISDLNSKIYLCGPEPMMESVERQLGKLQLGAEAIIKEAF